MFCAKQKHLEETNHSSVCHVWKPIHSEKSVAKNVLIHFDNTVEKIKGKWDSSTQRKH